MSNTKKKSTVLAIAAGFAISLAGAPVASAASNPFQADKLSSGYNLASSHDVNSIGDNSDNDNKANDHANGDNDKVKDNDKNDKAKEGRCGTDKEDNDKTKDGKCGAGRCGS